MNSSLVGVVIGGVLVIVANFITDLYQRQRDRRALLIRKYETLALAAQKFLRTTMGWMLESKLATVTPYVDPAKLEEVKPLDLEGVNLLEGMDPFPAPVGEVATALNEFTDAYTILSLEPDQQDVASQCDAIRDMYLQFYLKVVSRPYPALSKDLDPEAFGKQFVAEHSKLIENLRAHKRRLEIIFPKIRVSLTR